VEAVRVDGRLALRCTECSHQLAEYHGDYKREAAMRELPITALSPLNAGGLIDEVVLREFLCPGCGTALAIDVQLRDEAICDEAIFTGMGAQHEQ
jgi:acetone carboxylase gamma subunit